VTVTDDGLSNRLTTVTFRVTVTNVNDAPVISDLPSVTLDEDGVTAALPLAVADLERPPPA